MGQAAAATRAGSAGAPRYARHRPEQTLLYRVSSSQPFIERQKNLSIAGGAEEGAGLRLDLEMNLQPALCQAEDVDR